MEEEPNSCFCCPARRCLMSWSGFSVGYSITTFILTFTTADYTDGHTVIAVVSNVVNIIASIFALTAAVNKSRCILKVTFLVVTLNLLGFVALLILGILIITGTITTLQFNNISGAMFIVIDVIGFGIQTMLLWTVKKTLDDVNLAKNAVNNANNDNYNY